MVSDHLLANFQSVLRCIRALLLGTLDNTVPDLIHLIILCFTGLTWQCRPCLIRLICLKYCALLDARNDIVLYRSRSAASRLA